MKIMLLTSILWTIVMLQSVVFAGEACNEYVDGILRDLREDEDIFLDPYTIPEKSVEVHKKVLFINYTGEASIYDGYIYGMNTLHRDDDVVIDRKKKIHLKVWLGAGELKLQCSGKIKLMGHGPQVKIEAKVVYVNMKFDVTPTTAGNNPKMSNFKIEDVKGLEVKVSGMGPLNFFLNTYIKVLGKIFKNLIRNAIETRLKAFLDKKIKKYEIPEECLNSTY